MSDDKLKFKFALPDQPSIKRGKTGSDKVRGNPAQNKDYWLDVGFSVFEAERTQFRVPNYQFIRGSSVFASMYTLPQDSAEQESIIKLPGVSAQDFSRLLKVLYPLEGNINLSSDEWISVLRLSTMWYMLEFRGQAVSQLSKGSSLTPTQKIELGRELKVSEWFASGCHEFVTREQVFTEEEVAAIGASLCIHLFRIREERWRADKRVRFSGDWRAVVIDKLKDEIKGIAQDEKGYQAESKQVEKGVQGAPKFGLHSAVV